MVYIIAVDSNDNKIVIVANLVCSLQGIHMGQCSFEKKDKFYLEAIKRCYPLLLKGLLCMQNISLKNFENGL